MEFNQYQEEARKSAIYPNKGNNFIYPTLGLAGEAGEVAEKIKKIIRDSDGIVSEEKKSGIGQRTGRCFMVYFQFGRGAGTEIRRCRKGEYRKIEIAPGERQGPWQRR